MSNPLPGPQRWQQARAEFEAALALPPAQRRAHVEHRVADPLLRADVLSLLDHAGDTSALDGLAPGAAARWLLGDQAGGADARLAPGSRLGAWRIVREVGQGGMGRVYEAERADGAYSGRAAIKLLRQAGAAGVLRRFALERQALARLAHPNIARLIDAGSHDVDGSPYLVMEWVDGQPLDRACIGLDVDARLRLFLQLADAVAYAHQNLLLHRDLKPGNVLVDAAGQVKLLDFGIAKLLDDTDAELADITHQHDGTLLRPFTPNYASPEQVRGEPVTTASDVYALGILLYLLLTGQRPYGRGATSAQQAIDAVLGEQPARPSQVADPQLELAAGAAPNAAQLRRRLRGDLDNIVLKALDKEPARRYASVAALADDLRRHLGGLPVAARPPRPAYLIGKFLRRHRVASAALAVGMAGLLVGTAVAWQQALRAERRLAEVRRLSNDLVFKYHDQIAQLPGSTPVRAALLHDALGHLDAMAADARHDRRLARELAETYNRIAALQGDTFSPSTEQLALAERSLDKARALLPRFVDARSTDLAALRAASEIYTGCGVLALRLARQDKALECQLQALALLERARTRTPGDIELLAALATAQGRLGMIYGSNQFSASLGQWSKAEAHVRAALAGMQDLLAREPDKPERMHQLAWAWQMLAGWELLQGRFGPARAAITQAVAMRERSVERAPDNLQYRHQLSSARLALGVALALDGRADEAVALQRPELARMEDNIRADPANRVARRDRAIAGISLSRSLLAAGRCAELLAQLQESIAMLEAGPLDPRDFYVHRLLAEAHLNRARCLRADDPNAALAAVERAVALLDPERAAVDGLAPAARLALAQAHTWAAAWRLELGDAAAARADWQRAAALWAAEAAQGPIAGLYRGTHAQFEALAARLRS
jgi:serine/threonine protein kinase